MAQSGAKGLVAADFSVVRCSHAVGRTDLLCDELVPNIRSLGFMKTLGRKSLVSVLIWLGLASVLVVGLKYWYWERTLYADETGHRSKMPFGGAEYTRAFDAVYFPSKSLVHPIVRRLPVGGVAIDLAADLVAVALQHAALVFVLYALLMRRYAKSTGAGHDKAQ